MHGLRTTQTHLLLHNYRDHCEGFLKAILGFYFRSSKKCWMTSQVFSVLIVDVFQKQLEDEDLQPSTSGLTFFCSKLVTTIAQECNNCIIAKLPVIVYLPSLFAFLN